MQNHELKITKRMIKKHLGLIALEQQSKKKASDTVKLGQHSIGRLSRVDALQQQAIARAIDKRRENEKSS